MVAQAFNLCACTGKMPVPPKTFQDNPSWVLGPPVRPEKLVLIGGTAFPGCAQLTCFPDTGWKACATDVKNFSKQVFLLNFRGAAHLV
jgi:hypothetical protein